MFPTRTSVKDGSLSQSFLILLSQMQRFSVLLGAAMYRAVRDEHATVVLVLNLADG